MISLNEALLRFKSLRSSVDRLQGRKAELETTLAKHLSKITELDKEVEMLQEARGLYQKCSTFLRLKVSDKFASLATKALQYIFQREDLSFIVELDVKANLPAAAFFVEIGGHKLNPKEALGGSIYEVLGICLRLVCLEIFDLKGPLILDEPLRSVDSNNLTNALEFILAYCKETGRQLFIVTHNDQITEFADKLFEVSQVKGLSEVKELK